MNAVGVLVVSWRIERLRKELPIPRSQFRRMQRIDPSVETIRFRQVRPGGLLEPRQLGRIQPRLGMLRRPALQRDHQARPGKVVRLAGGELVGELGNPNRYVRSLDLSHRCEPCFRSIVECGTTEIGSTLFARAPLVDVCARRLTCRRPVVTSEAELVQKRLDDVEADQSARNAKVPIRSRSTTGLHKIGGMSPSLLK